MSDEDATHPDYGGLIIPNLDHVTCGEVRGVFLLVLAEQVLAVDVVVGGPDDGVVVPEVRPVSGRAIGPTWSNSTRMTGRWTR
jgi:hypothetical protein